MNTQHEHPKDLHEALDWLIAGELEHRHDTGKGWSLTKRLRPTDTIDKLRRKPSPIATGHNPDKFTERQVETDKGWRLLDEDEVLNSSDANKSLDSLQCWTHGWEDETWRGDSYGSTYRTRLSRAELRKARGLEESKPDPYAELKAAHAAGKVIEVRPILGEWLPEPLPTWSFPVERYRIKPDPQPWSSQDDVPGPVCWISGNDKDGPIAMMVVNVHTTGVTLAEGSAVYHYHWAMLKGRNYSTDRKTWKPCVK